MVNRERGSRRTLPNKVRVTRGKVGARGRIEQVGSQREAVASDAQTRSTVRRITTLEFIINASSVDLKKKTNESTKTRSFVRPSFVRLCALWHNRKKEIWHRSKDRNYRTTSFFFSFLLLELECIGVKERERERDSKEGKGWRM